jgi:hypothetical protein
MANQLRAFTVRLGGKRDPCVDAGRRDAEQQTAASDRRRRGLDPCSLGTTQRRTRTSGIARNSVRCGGADPGRRVTPSSRPLEADRERRHSGSIRARSGPPSAERGRRQTLRRGMLVRAFTIDGRHIQPARNAGLDRRSGGRCLFVGSRLMVVTHKSRRSPSRALEEPLPWPRAGWNAGRQTLWREMLGRAFTIDGRHTQSGGLIARTALDPACASQVLFAEGTGTEMRRMSRMLRLLWRREQGSCRVRSLRRRRQSKGISVRRA